MKLPINLFSAFMSWHIGHTAIARVYSPFAWHPRLPTISPRNSTSCCVMHPRDLLAPRLNPLVIEMSSSTSTSPKCSSNVGSAFGCFSLMYCAISS